MLAGEVEGQILEARCDRTTERRGQDRVIPAAIQVIPDLSFERPGVAIPAFPRHHVHDSRVDAAVFGVESSGLHHDLVDRIVRDGSRRESGQRVLLRESIHVVGHLVGAASADDEGVAVLDLGSSAHLIQIVQVERDHARLLGHRLLVPAQRLVPDLVTVQEFGGGGDVLLDERPLPLHLDLFDVLENGRGHVEIRLGVEVGEHLDAFADLRDVAEQSDADGVLAREQIEDEIVTLSVGRRPPLELGDRNRGEPDRLARGRVTDGSRDPAGSPGAGRSRRNKKGAAHDQDRGYA
jgi:hypothetical protein